MVFANMIGAGVFLSTGFMAQDLRPGEILLAWAVGAVLALCGVRVYSAAAVLLPESGGEYRYLSILLHRSLGHLTGWTTMLIGFSAPVAIDALAVGAFAETMHFPVSPQLTATSLIVGISIAHALQLKTSLWTQNLLVAIKALLLGGFIAAGLTLGSWEWPNWQPPRVDTSFPLRPFMNSLFFIMFAFSGWNAAIYAASEFRHPQRDIPRAMLIGCLGVTGIYFLVNWIFVANLTPDQARAVFDYENTRITLGHLVIRNLTGPVGGSAMSVAMILVLTSAVSAMTLVGPRVCSAMARDGFLPRQFFGTAGRPPRTAIALQSMIAMLLVWSQSLTQMLQSMGAILTIFAALTALSLFRVALDPRFTKKPGQIDMVAAAVYILASGILLFFGFQNSPNLLFWIGALSGISLGFYLISR